jgi:hypothetical protein
MTQRADDLRVLNELLNEHAEQLSEQETEAFASMRFDMTGYSVGNRAELTDRQRAWVRGVYERIVPQYANLVSRGLVPRGKEVPTPLVLQNLPKRPPPMPRPGGGALHRGSKRHCGREDDGCYAFVNGDCSCGCCR